MQILDVPVNLPGQSRCTGQGDCLWTDRMVQRTPEDRDSQL